jgi:transcriptional regulator with XRE-family HTH domain
MKTAEREQARKLRRECGVAVKEIARLVGVSQSSVSQWVRDVPLTPEQLEVLRQANPAYNRQLRGANRNAEKGRARRTAFQEEGRLLARLGEPFHAAGAMLYWAEGDKRSKNAARLSNSDPEVLRYFLRFLRTYFDALDAKLRITCHLFADHLERQLEIEKFWLNTCELPETCLRKSFVNVYSKYSQKKRKNKLPYGTCHLIVHDTRIVQSIFGSIQEYGGFDRPEWLG